jgi:hypothetical protein
LYQGTTSVVPFKSPSVSGFSRSGMLAFHFGYLMVADLVPSALQALADEKKSRPTLKAKAVFAVTVFR